MKNLLFLFFIFLGTSTYGQSKLWTKPVAKGTTMSQFEDGRLLLHNKTSISLVNNSTGEKYWDRSITTKTPPEFLINLPIMFFEGSPFRVIDASTGYVIDQSLEKSNIIGINYFWELGFVVIEMKRNKNLHVLNINLKDPTKSWNVNVGQAKKSSLDKVYRMGENPPVFTKSGLLVVFDRKYIAILDKQGSLVKKMGFQEKIQLLDYNVEKDVLYVLEGKKRLHFINIGSEYTPFKSLKNNDLKFNILGDGSTISIVQENELKVLDAVNLNEIEHHVFDEKIKAGHIDPENNRFYVLTKNTIAEIDTSSGALIRKKTFGIILKDIYEVFGKTIVDVSSGACPIDLKTFEFEYPNIPKIPEVYDYVEFDDYTGYIYFKNDRFKFSVVDKTGEVIWKKSYNPTFIPSVDVVGNGLLIMSEEEVTYLNFHNGECIWSDEIKVDPSFTYAVDEITNDLYVYANRRIYKFDYSTGSLSKSQLKFKFEDFDYDILQPQIFVLDDAIFLKGSNTIFILDKDGTLKHFKTYKRISTGSTILDLATVVVTAVAIGTGNADEIITVYSDGYYNQGGLVDALDIGSDISNQMKFERRLKQNRNSDFYPYVFTKLENGKRGLIFINPSTGEERFSIELEEKNPSYIVDDGSGVLYHLQNESLTAYNIKYQ